MSRDNPLHQIKSPTGEPFDFPEPLASGNRNSGRAILAACAATSSGVERARPPAMNLHVC